MVKGGPGPVPGQRDSANKGKEGKGKKEGGRKETVNERACGADGSMDRWTEKRARDRAGGQGKGAGKIRRGKLTKESHGQQWLEFVLLIAHGEG